MKTFNIIENGNIIKSIKRKSKEYAFILVYDFDPILQEKDLMSYVKGNGSESETEKEQIKLINKSLENGKEKAKELQIYSWSNNFNSLNGKISELKSFYKRYFSKNERILKVEIK